MYQRSESAVSESIGTILVVAVTVMMAALIMMYSSGLTQNVQKTYIVSVTATSGSDGNPLLVFKGGQDTQYLTSLTTVYDDGTTELWPAPAVVIGGSVPVRAGERHVKVIGNFNSKIDQVVLDAKV